MKLLKRVVKLGFICLLLASFGITQEVQAAPPITAGGLLELDFDMKLPDGSPYSGATVLVDIVDEEAFLSTNIINNIYLQIGGQNAKDILITPSNGNYYHRYGVIQIGNAFPYSGGYGTFKFDYYTNLRIMPGKNIKSLTLGDKKTVHVSGVSYDQTWSNPYIHDYEHTLVNGNNMFTTLPNGVFLYNEENFLTSTYNRPTVLLGSFQMGQHGNNAYYGTRSKYGGKKVNFVATPYQVKENYVDSTGAPLTPPAGFTQGKLTDATAEQFTHTLTGLPTSYSTGGNNYVLKGSYKGPTNPGTLSQSNPPSITVDYTDSSIPDFDDEGQITVVYALAVNLTEKYVDESGSQIDPAWDPASPISVEDGEPFTIPHTLGDTKTDSSGSTWEYVGWKYDTDSAGTKRTTPTTNTINGNTSIEYIYKQTKTTASLDLTPNPQIVDNNGTISWTSRLANTGNAPLKDLVLKATSNWSTGLTDPVQVIVTPAGGSPQSFTVGAGDWVSGVNLTGVTIPSTSSSPNNYADITFSTTATGAVNQVLPAEIEVDGNIPTPITADNFVRIDDPDERNLKPTGNAGLINLPDFRFGDVEVKPFAQTKGLDSASYQAGAGYSPYIRFMDKESNFGWDLTVKLGQFTSGSQTLPTTTSITLKNGALKEVQNYDKASESLSNISSVGNKTIFSDGNTVPLTNGLAQGVYQLDYAFNDVELDLMAHSGVAGLSYTADLDWTLTTAP